MTDMSRLKPYDNYQPVQYDYVAELPEGWQLLPNLAIFQSSFQILQKVNYELAYFFLAYIQ